MSRFCPLASSSKGNSIFVSGGNTSLLIDAGISFKRIRESLHSIGSDISNIHGILLTHEHGDHTSGLPVLLKHHNIPLFATEKTLHYLTCRGLVPTSAVLVPVSDRFVVGEIEVTPFDTPHDAVHSVGFRLELPDGRKIGYATDLGHVTKTVSKQLSGCDLVMLESNFDPGMLQCSAYPYILKRRISSSEGHLSNQDCAEQIMELTRKGTTRFLLGHLSENNNLPALAFETTKAHLDTAKMKVKQDYLLSVAPARTCHELVVF